MNVKVQQQFEEPAPPAMLGRGMMSFSHVFGPHCCSDASGLVLHHFKHLLVSPKTSPASIGQVRYPYWTESFAPDRSHCRRLLTQCLVVPPYHARRRLERRSGVWCLQATCAPRPDLAQSPDSFSIHKGYRMPPCAPPPVVLSGAASTARNGEQLAALPTQVGI